MKIPQRSLLITQVMRAPFRLFRSNLWLSDGGKTKKKKRLKKNTFCSRHHHHHHHSVDNVDSTYPAADKRVFYPYYMRWNNITCGVHTRELTRQKRHFSLRVGGGGFEGIRRFSTRPRDRRVCDSSKTVIL